MANILDDIKAYKLQEVKHLKRLQTHASLQREALSQPPCRGFKSKLIAKKGREKYFK